MILQTVASTQRRGAEIFAVQLAAELEGRGWPVATVALEGAGTRPLEVPLVAPGDAGLATRIAILRRRARASAAVVAHGSTTLPACALATAGTPVDFVYRSIGDPAWWGRGRVRRARTRALLRRARLVVVVWSGAADHMTRVNGLPRDRVRVIPNGVPEAAFPLVSPQRRTDARRRLGLADEAPVAVYMGSLSAEKNVPAAIDAVAAVPGVHLVIAGDGPQQARIAEHARQRLPGRATLLGATPDPAGVLAAADVVVLPSWTEGSPAVLIEAGLSGIPVVATAVGGVGEIVRAGETGVLVRAGDVEGLAAGIRDVVASPGELGRDARQHCLRRYSLSAVAGHWSQLLEEVVA